MHFSIKKVGHINAFSYLRALFAEYKKVTTIKINKTKQNGNITKD